MLLKQIREEFKMEDELNFYDLKNTPGAKDKTGVLYSDISNASFAYRLWEKQKNDAKDLNSAIPMGVWADSVGLSNKDFKSMVSLSKTEGYDPTGRTMNDSFEPEDSGARLTFQGQTFGWGDEIVGGMTAVGDVLTGKSEEASFGELYTKYRDSERQKIEEYRKNFPLKALGYEVAGSFATPLAPLTALKVPSLIKKLSTTKKAMAASGTGGLIYGAGASTKDDLSGIAKDSMFGGITASLFGYGLNKAIPVIKKSKLGEQAKKWMGIAQDTPRIETLQIAKNAAYALADKSEARFGRLEFSGLYEKALMRAKENNYEEYGEGAVKGTLAILKNLRDGSELKNLSQLDKIRQNIAKKYKANPDQTALLNIMDEIDNVIKIKSTDFPDLALARIANSKYKKAELFDEAFENVKIDLENATGGVSELKLYKDAITSILKDKRKMQYFSAEEADYMRKILKGNILDRTFGRTAELSPGVNRLMTMAAFAGSYLQPWVVVPTVLGLVANKITNATMRKKADDLIDVVGDIKKPVINEFPVESMGGAAFVAGTENYPTQ